MSAGGFQPFGYSFEVRSNLSPDLFKASLRKKWKRWFDKRDGARGWMVGPVLCLWNTWSPYGPMVIATISERDRGTRVTGRAGSDLNGFAYAFVICAVALFMLGRTAIERGLSRDGLILIGIVGGAVALLLWSQHRDRGEADPLVRFLTSVDQLSDKRPKRGVASSVTVSFDHLTLTFDGGRQSRPVTSETIEQTLFSLESGGFLILASADETYMQVAEVGDEFVIERRDGDHRSHVRAVYADGRSGHESDAGTTFSAEVTLETLLAYAAGKSMPRILDWRPL